MFNSFIRNGLFVTLTLLQIEVLRAETLYAGIGRAEITDRRAGPVNDPSYVKALVLRSGTSTAVLLTVDAVAIGGIGRVSNDYLPRVRSKLQTEFNIPPNHVIVNASHCHSVIQSDCVDLTVGAVRDAYQSLEPVQCGVGIGDEAHISENRRLILKDGREADMRRAYALPPNDEIAEVGPIDPQVGVLRVDRINGTPLAVVYHFACHPIMGAPAGGNTAGFPGFASKIIEETCGNPTTAFFVQGCAGDINPVHYKSFTPYKSDEQIGQRLGIKVMQIWRAITTKPEADLNIQQSKVIIPWAEDFEDRIAAIDLRRQSLVNALKPTDIQFDNFLPLWIQRQLSPNHPSDSAQAYLHEAYLKQSTLIHHDATIKANLDAYATNIRTMEELTRLNVNRTLLVKHKAMRDQAESKPLEAELMGLKVGEFKLLTFPGELTVEIGLGLKQNAKPFTFIAGYTNGYYFYLPTVAQRQNIGFAQEDCDCIVSPLWQAAFEKQATAMLENL